LKKISWATHRHVNLQNFCSYFMVSVCHCWRVLSIDTVIFLFLLKAQCISCRHETFVPYPKWIKVNYNHQIWLVLLSRYGKWQFDWMSKVHLNVTLYSFCTTYEKRGNKYRSNFNWIVRQYKWNTCIDEIKK